MAGDNHGAETTQEQEAAQELGGEQTAQEQQEVTAAGGIDYEKQIAERDEKIASLEAQVAEAAKNAETAEQLRGEIASLKQQSADERVDFSLQLAGCRNVKAARAVLPDYEDDIDKLKAGEPWLFEDSGKHFKGGAGGAGATGATGLPNAGAATDAGKTMRRWREIAGLADDVSDNAKKEG